MGKIVKNGVTYSGSSDNADNVKYNNNVSNLDATNVQEAIDKLDESVDTLNSNLSDLIKVQSFIREPEQIDGEYQIGIDVSISGYVPIGVVGFDVNNRFNIAVTGVILEGNTVIFRGFTSELTKLTPKATVLFLKA